MENEKKITLSLSKEQYRHLLDIVFTGNEILTSIVCEPGNRVNVYDAVESEVFRHCRENGLADLVKWDFDSDGKFRAQPSEKYINGGISQVLDLYDESVFFESLAEELAARDVETIETEADAIAFEERVDTYLDEFEKNGTDNVVVEIDE